MPKLDRKPKFAAKPHAPASRTCRHANYAAIKAGEEQAATKSPRVLVPRCRHANYTAIKAGKPQTVAKPRLLSRRELHLACEGLTWTPRGMTLKPS